VTNISGIAAQLLKLFDGQFESTIVGKLKRILKFE
jgi:hypothetical protein